MVRSAFARSICICSCLLLILLSLSTAQAQSTGKILGHTYLGALVSVDPGTGAVTSVGSVATTIQNIRLSALDSAGHRYFFLDDSFNLYVLDTQTGSQIAGPLSVPLVLVGMKFDPSSGKLFGHTYLGGTLVTIDPATGNVTTVASVQNGGSLSAQLWIAALDSAGHRYFFLDSTPTLYVFNFNTQTGAQITALPLTTALFPTAMEFDPSSGKLFCHTQLPSTGAETLLSIDPATGNVASFGTWPNSASLFAQDGLAALDSTGHRYFFLDDTGVGLQQMNIAGQTGVAGAATTLSVGLFLMGMEFAPSLSSPPPPPPPPPPDPSPYKAQVQPPLNPDGPGTFSTSRGSVPVKFTLTKNGVATCDLPAATISLVRTAGATTGTVDSSLYWMPSDNSTNFRNSGCQYVYNLGTSGLGVGTYEADITIAGNVVGKATFTLGR
jgi:hypothetical protein